MDEIKEYNDRTYAIIIDEAHSSQTGETAKKMKQVLATNSLEEAEKFELKGYTYNSVQAAYRVALSESYPEDIIVVAGSSFILAEVI